MSIPGGFGGSEEGETEDWGGDLMDVNDDEGDWSGFSRLFLALAVPEADLILLYQADGFESGRPRVDPFAARLSATKPKAPAVRRGGAMKLGAPTRSSALRVPMGVLLPRLTSCYSG